MESFTKVPNEVLEQIAKVKLSPTQFRLLFVIWRYTIGFHREEHALSLSFLVKATGCERRNIQRELEKLQARKIIVQKIINGKSRVISFNKNYKCWVGHATNGEIANGESAKSTYGETTNTTLGHTDNQERYKETSKQIDIKDRINPAHEYEKLFGVPSIALKQQFNYWIHKCNFQEPEKTICFVLNLVKKRKPNNAAAYLTTAINKLHELGLYNFDDVVAHYKSFNKKDRTYKKGTVPPLTDMFDKTAYNSKKSRAEEIAQIEELENDLPY